MSVRPSVRPVCAPKRNNLKLVYTFPRGAINFTFKSPGFGLALSYGCAAHCITKRTTAQHVDTVPTFFVVESTITNTVIGT